MPHYHLGRTEAEMLIRNAPPLVPTMRERARRDRGRLTTRLFQPDKKRFLDGFLDVLDEYIAHGEVAPPPVRHQAAATRPAAPPPSLPSEDAPSPRAVPAHAEAEILSEPPAAAESPAPAAAVNVDGDEIERRAVGVWRLSGWSEPEFPPPDPVMESEESAAIVGAILAPTDWSDVFSHVRVGGVVDLSAYDMIDQLGELRQLIDQWREQNAPSQAPAHE